MADIVSTQSRSRMMSGIRSKNTKPEIYLRKGLHARGYRYRLHGKNLPGKPDIIFPKYFAVLFVHGCFWHGHDCHLFKMPKSNIDFWHNKISRNKELDHIVIEKLTAIGWRVGVVWECAIKGKTRLSPDVLFERIEAWLHASHTQLNFEETLPNNI